MESSLARGFLAACILCSCSVRATHDRDELILHAFRQLCEPIHDPLPRPAWTPAMLKVQEDERLPLSEQDVEDILALGEKYGIDEPVLIRSGTDFVIRAHLGAVIAERPQEDRRNQLRNYRYLFLEPVTDSATHRDSVGGWQLGAWLPNRDDPWMKVSHHFIRFDSEVWEYSTQSDVDPVEARSAWVAYVTGDLICAEGLELPRSRASLASGRLGYISTRQSGMLRHFPPQKLAEFDWDLEIELPFLQCSSSGLALKRVGSRWHVVLSW